MEGGILIVIILTHGLYLVLILTNKAVTFMYYLYIKHNINYIIRLDQHVNHHKDETNVMIS